MLNKILRILGHDPITTKGDGIKYRSPFNPTEKTASFFVFKNDKSGEYTNFKDYSSGAGGDVFNFIMQYFQIDFVSAKIKISELTGSDCQEHTRPMQNLLASAYASNPKTAPIFSFNQQKEMNEKSYQIIKATTLENKALLVYLQERGLNAIELHERFIGEVYYKMNQKHYFALSFANDSGGREIRNKYFKGSFGDKDISTIFITPTDRRVKVFEGFIDFLSYLQINRTAPLSNYLILNSASLQERGLRAIEGKYETIELYLDNDKRGDEATAFFMENFKNSIDKRVHYKEHKDLNDYLLKNSKK